MKKLLLLLYFIASFGITNAQVKQNDKGLYVNVDGSLYNGTLETEENGVKKSVIEVREGQMNGEVKYFYTSGKLMEVGVFTNGVKSGKWTRYNEAGNMIGIAGYKHGKKDGTWIVWDDNGKKRFEMTYSNGEKTGVWNSWDENGTLVSSKDYGQIN